MAGKKGGNLKKKQGGSTLASSGSQTTAATTQPQAWSQESLQFNNQIINQLCTEFQDFLKTYTQSVSSLQPSTSLLDQLKEQEVPQKFKIGTEDLEVRCEEFKTLEISNKKQANTQQKPQEVYCSLQEARTSLYQRYSG